MSILQIESIRAHPGQKASGYCHVPVGIADVRLPIMIINGSQPGPRLTLTSGVHFGEFVGIEALINILKIVDPLRLKGQMIACPLANPPSSYAQRMDVSPIDEINPNRVFPGNLTGNPTERLVGWIFENLVRSSDVYLDLHGGGVCSHLIPFTAYRTSGNESQDHQALEIADAFGLPDVVRGKTTTDGNSHAAATREKIVSLLIEAGQLGERPLELINRVRDGVLRVMEKMGMIEPSLPPIEDPIRHWVWVGEMKSTLEGLWYPEFEMGVEVPKDALLGRIFDPLGNVLSTIYASVSGKVFYGERGLIVNCGSILAAIAECED
jgi:uncharacterized protein